METKFEEEFDFSCSCTFSNTLGTVDIDEPLDLFSDDAEPEDQDESFLTEDRSKVLKMAQ